MSDKRDLIDEVVEDDFELPEGTRSHSVVWRALYKLTFVEVQAVSAAVQQVKLQTAERGSAEKKVTE
jgi:hypothetical protein